MPANATHPDYDANPLECREVRSTLRIPSPQRRGCTRVILFIKVSNWFPFFVCFVHFVVSPSGFCAVCNCLRPTASVSALPLSRFPLCPSFVIRLWRTSAARFAVSLVKYFLNKDFVVGLVSLGYQLVLTFGWRVSGSSSPQNPVLRFAPDGEAIADNHHWMWPIRANLQCRQARIRCMRSVTERQPASGSVTGRRLFGDKKFTVKGT